METKGTPSGFRDLLPKEARQREYMLETIVAIYKRFGFNPLETPVAEFEEVIVGEKASDFNLFYLESNKERQGEGKKEEVTLRFDLTVPLARVVSQYGNDLPRPFKRYQMGPVFRGEKPQKGRYRQFMQLDADVVGSKSLASDAEMVAMIGEVMTALEVGEFVIRINTRTLLNTLPGFVGFAENLLSQVLIILDKSEKISQSEMKEELERLRVKPDAIAKLVEFSAISGDRNKVLETLKEFFGEYFEAEAGIEELEELSKRITALGIGGEAIFDMKIIRGLGYYTGPVFETNLVQAPEFGSVMSGGRYDNLTERFSPHALPAVGVSVGVDRLQTALSELKLLETIDTEISRIVVFARDSQFEEYALSVAQNLRSSGYVADVYVGSKQEFSEIIQYAGSVGANYLCIVGEDEVSGNTVSIKNLSTRNQESYPKDSISLPQ